MRILQIHTQYRQAGGEDAVVAAEAALLRSGGHEVVEWRNSNPPDRKDAVIALTKSSWNRGSAQALVADLEGEFDVAHVHNTWFATTPSILPQLTSRGIPVVMTLHNYRLTCANALLLRDGSPCELCVGSHPWHAARYKCYRGSRVESTLAAAAIAINRRRGIWTDHVGRFLALTEFARSTMVRAGLPGEKVTVKPNFVEDPGERAEAPSTSNRVLFVGRLSPEKGVATLVEAWRHRQRDDLELVIAGSGPLESELAAVADPTITMLGRVPADEVKRLMSTCRALVFPSEWYEGMPITLLEAMAGGLPILASNLGSMTEMIAPLGDDWLTTPGSVDEWRAALDGLRTADVDAAGKIARQLWVDLYSPRVGLDALIAAYDL